MSKITNSYEMWLEQKKYGGHTDVVVEVACLNCGSALPIKMDKAGAITEHTCESCGAVTEATLMLHLSVVEMPCDA